MAAVATGSIATFRLIEVRDARSTSEMETLPACVMLCDVSGRVPLGHPEKGFCVERGAGKGSGPHRCSPGLDLNPGIPDSSLPQSLVF